MAFSSSSSVEIPPFQLQQLIPYVFGYDVPDSGLGFSNSATPVKPQVTCAQAIGSEIYIGCSDGGLFRFALQVNGPDTSDSYTLLSHQTLPTQKRIDEIALCPSISRALILTGNQIHFYTLPSLDPVPPNLIRPIRNVVSFAVDEQHMRLPPSTDPINQIPPVNLCVMKRDSVTMYVLKDKLVHQKELPVSGLRYGRRIGRLLCGADEANYNLVDLVDNLAIPLLPFNQKGEGGNVRPFIFPISEEEFLVLSDLGVSAMGVFINNEGNPVRGTLEFQAYPLSICVEYPHVAALLPDQTIKVYSIETQAVVQTVPWEEGSASGILLSSHNGFLVPSIQRTEKLGLVSLSLDSLTPSPASKSSSRPPIFPRSNILVASENTISSLLPSTLISQAEALLERRCRDDVVDLAEQSQRRVMGSSAADEDLADELRYVYQRLGWQAFSDTLFEDAGKYLLEGGTDPRLLVRYFPNMCGNLLEGERVELFGGLVKHLPHERSIDEIVMADLVKNYAPHIKPDVESAPPTAELRRILCTTAEDMLASYLRKYRTRRLVARSGAKANDSHVNAVVDTVLAKLLAMTDQISELYGLVDDTNDIVVDEVESAFEKNGQYNALCKLYANKGDEERLLECWARLIDGTWSDEDIKDPMSQMTNLLQQLSNRPQVQKWALWLMERDAQIGLQLILSRDSKRMSRADELSLLAQIRRANEEAGVQYLEQLVVQKGLQDPTLLNELASIYIDRLIVHAKDDATSKLWRAKAASYASSRSESPFVLYFASSTPDSISRNVRLKTLLFLSSPLPYDPEPIMSKLVQEDKLQVLKLEVAIIQGKRGRHEDALTTLVRDVGDYISAEAYCALGGTWVVPPKVRITIGERCGLQKWAALAGPSSIGLSASNAERLIVSPSMSRASSGAGTETMRVELLKVLLGVYMSGGQASMTRTSRLLNAQALNLDPVDILPLLPESSSLPAFTPYITSHLRLLTRQSHEASILKSLSAGQNREVVYRCWAKIREAGAVVEEAASDDDEKGEREGYEGDESEKREWVGGGNGEGVREKVAKMQIDAGGKELRGLGFPDRLHGETGRVDIP